MIGEQWERNEVETTFVEAIHTETQEWMEQEEVEKKKQEWKKQGWNFQGDDCAWYFFTSFLLHVQPQFSLVF